MVIRKVILFVLLITATSFANGQSKSQLIMLERINVARAEQTAIDGVFRQELVWNFDLAKAASTYARECSKTIWMHNLYPTTYVKEHSNYFKGYNGQVGELLTYPLKLDPVSVWFMSDKHRAVLMLPWWKDIGIGTAGGKDSGAVCYVGIRWPVNGSSP